MSLNDRIEKIKNKILSTNNEELSQELENDRANLRTLRDIIQEKIDNKKEDNYDINEMLDNIEEIFNDPVAMRENSNYDVRQLLFKVRFG